MVFLGADLIDPQAAVAVTEKSYRDGGDYETRCSVEVWNRWKLGIRVEHGSGVQRAQAREVAGNEWDGSQRWRFQPTGSSARKGSTNGGV